MTNSSLHYEWSNTEEIQEFGATKSGIEFLEAWLSGHIEPPICGLLGISLIAVEKGRVTFTYIPSEAHYNAIGSVHGGVVTTVLDTAAGCALHTCLDDQHIYTTVEVKCNFIRPIRVPSEPLRCVGDVISAGKRIGVSKATMMDSSGNIVAYASSSLLIMDKHTAK